MIAKLEASFSKLGPVGQTHAAGLLLQEGKRTHLDIHLQGYSSSDEKVREAAFGAPLNTSDRSVPDESYGSASPIAPFTRDELFAALKPLLDDTNHSDHRRGVYKLINQDFRRGRPYLIAFLNHEDASERLSAAQVLLQNGTDSGALTILEDFITCAPEMDPDGSPRWYDIQGISRTFAEACKTGGPELTKKIGLITQRAISKTLSSPNWKVHTHDGFLDVWNLIEVLQRARPPGFEALLTRIINSGLSKETRGRALGALVASDGNGRSHQDLILTSLENSGFKKHAAQGLCRYGPTTLTTTIINRIEGMLRDEDDEESIGYLATILNKVAPDQKSALTDKLDQMPPMTAMNLYWKIENYSITDIYAELRQANIIDAVPEDILEQTLLTKDGDLDIATILYEAGKRLTVVTNKQTSAPEHGEAFKDLLALLRPQVQVKHVIQTINDHAKYEPLEENLDIIKRTELGTVSKVEYVLNEQVFSFDASPMGRWLDMAAVHQHANAFLERIDHPQRFYAMDIDWGDFSLYFSADWEAFSNVQKMLRIPIVDDLEKQRQAGLEKVAQMLRTK